MRARTSRVRADRLFPALQQGHKAALLDQIEQFFFGREIIIQAGQAHLGRARDIAHRGVMKSLFRENLGRGFENLLELFVVVTGCGLETIGHGCWILANRSSGCQTTALYRHAVITARRLPMKTHRGGYFCADSVASVCTDSFLNRHLPWCISKSSMHMNFENVIVEKDGADRRRHAEPPASAQRAFLRAGQRSFAGACRSSIRTMKFASSSSPAVKKSSPPAPISRKWPTRALRRAHSRAARLSRPNQQDRQAGDRGGERLRPGRRLRAGDELRHHHRLRDRALRPARSQSGHHSRQRRHAAIDAFARQASRHGTGADRRYDQRNAKRNGWVWSIA